MRGNWGLAARGSLIVSFWTFLLAILVTLLSTAVIASLPMIVAVFLILAIVFIGVIFDMIGLAAAAATQAPFNAMAAKRVPGAPQAQLIVRKADFVSSFCSDLVGDICGTVAGAATAAIVFRLVASGVPVEQKVLNVVLVSTVAALTVGGKAAGKSYALARANEVVYRVARLLAGWTRLTAAVGRALSPARVRPTRPSSREVRRRGRDDQA